MIELQRMMIKHYASIKNDHFTDNESIVCLSEGKYFSVIYIYFYNESLLLIYGRFLRLWCASLSVTTSWIGN